MGIEDFIQRWTAREGGAERANYQMFLSELCDQLDVARPEPAGAERSLNDYVFERAVDGGDIDYATTRRIDLYKRGAFVLEAKQSRTVAGGKVAPGQLSLLPDQDEERGRRSVSRGWDVLMKNAFNQAREYARCLPTDHPSPLFLIVVDVGHCIELYADFSGTGRGYAQFPDRQGFRLYMDDLRREDIRMRLAAIWTDPASLDPTRELVRVTRKIADRLAEVSKALEARHPPEEVAHFLMRCIFTMFAEDVDLLPEGAFTNVLQDCVDSPGAFAPMLQDLWARMDDADHDRRFYSAFKTHLRHFNGNLFKNARAFPLGREEIGELLAAAKSDWTEVDPAIFGTLLEQALDKDERRRLGAHYTPRAYVERLVGVTVMEPLWADWEQVLGRVGGAMDSGERSRAVGFLKDFHRQLCDTRVLDPACGTGNFLYVALEMMKRLEGEVLERLAELGETETLGLDTVDPHQFLGLELNPRAAAIAELVVWIGYLQQHYRTHTGHPAEPILRAFRNINFGHRDGYDAVLTWDGYPLTGVSGEGGARVETYPNPRRPDWPEAEFIVGNPPFLGKGAGMRGPLGDCYVDALWAAHSHLPESIDFVMYWWDHAAAWLSRPGTSLRRFGFVTTNSISQTFNRKVIEHRITAKSPIHLSFAIADHPWSKVTRDAAAVRIAMTVAARGVGEGLLLSIVEEVGTDTDTPNLSFEIRRGVIHSNLTIGTNLTVAGKLLANSGICANGMLLSGAGFIISNAVSDHLGMVSRVGLEQRIRPYLKGKALYDGWKDQYAIDLFGLSEQAVRSEFPEVYQHLTETVRPERVGNSKAYREREWWLFGENNPRYREALSELRRYIATVETAKHRLFRFVDGAFMHDHMVVGIATEDAFALGVMSSHHHVVWATGQGGTLEDRPRYNKSRCFDPFPFPAPSDDLKAGLRVLGEELDATRKRVQAEHPDLTFTGLYNVLEKIRAGAPLTPADEDVKHRGLVLILRDLHQQIDDLTADAYGWPRDLADEQILERLVALNAERAKEEAEGLVRWLRPDYQIPRFAKVAPARTGELDLGERFRVIEGGRPAFPTDRYAQPLAVRDLLATAGRPMAPEEVARGFAKGGRRLEPRTREALTTLTRYGWATALPDGRYAVSRVA